MAKIIDKITKMAYNYQQFGQPQQYYQQQCPQYAQQSTHYGSYGNFFTQNAFSLNAWQVGPLILYNCQLKGKLCISHDRARGCIYKEKGPRMLISGFFMRIEACHPQELALFKLSAI